MDAIARYGETDLLCYRAETPEALVQRQTDAWQPWLEWAEQRHGVKLRVTTGIIARASIATIAALRAAVGALDPGRWRHWASRYRRLGSLVLGLALAEQRIDPATAHALGALDELFQAEQWGEDAQAAARRQAIAGDIALAARMIARLGIVRIWQQSV